MPLLLSVPHAGRDYPRALLDRLRVSPDALIRLEDRYVDRLAALAYRRGVPGIVARAPRAWVDLNRAADEVDSHMVDKGGQQDFAEPSAKVRGGLGLIPRRLTGYGELWRSRWPLESVRSRVETVHAPYHQAVAGALETMRRRFGGAILLDLHSMPPLDPSGPGSAPRIVIGDRYGQSASSRVCERAVGHMESLGFKVALNHPYAGGYNLARHGNPGANIHAIQIEIDRSLYLDRALREPVSDRVTAMAEAVESLAMALVDELGAGALPIAAE